MKEPIVVFSRATCFYCMKAKRYLELKKLSFKEFSFNRNSKEDLERLQSYAQKSGAQFGPIITVPQIFIAGHHVGGYTDLIKLSDQKLKNLINQ